MCYSSRFSKNAILVFTVVVSNSRLKCLWRIVKTEITVTPLIPKSTKRTRKHFWIPGSLIAIKELGIPTESTGLSRFWTLLLIDKNETITIVASWQILRTYLFLIIILSYIEYWTYSHNYTVSSTHRPFSASDPALCWWLWRNVTRDVKVIRVILQLWYHAKV